LASLDSLQGHPAVHQQGLPDLNPINQADINLCALTVDLNLGQGQSFIHLKHFGRQSLIRAGDAVNVVKRTTGPN
jgi:hypothetical protein